jgi:hypothetical protein
VTADVLGQVVTRLFVAAGRRATDVEFEVWREALNDIADDGAIDEARSFVKNLDLSRGAPSPATFRSSLMQRQARLRMTRVSGALPSGPRTDQERANVARIIAETRDLLRRPPQSADDGAPKRTAEELRAAIERLGA